MTEYIYIALSYLTLFCFLYSVILTEYVGIEARVCVCVRVCVCLSVCVISTAQTNGPILIRLYTNNFEYICQCRFFAIFEISNLMTL